MKDYWSHLISDPSFMGALLGAFLSSSIALLILILQMRSNKKQNQEKEYKAFFKHVSLLHLSLERYVKKINDENLEKILSNKSLATKFFIDSTEELKIIIEDIDDSVILHESFIYFSTIKVTLSGISEVLRFDLPAIESENDKVELKRIIMAYHKVLAKSVEEIGESLKRVKKFLKIK